MTAKADHQLTEQCPFHPLRDTYGMQDAARHKHRGIQWKCGFCGKIFRTEAFLDQHMDKNHKNEKHPSADVCLADLCEMLHCDHFVQGHGSNFKSFQQRTAPCRPKLKGQLKHHCQDIADACFPIANGKEAALMHEYFVEHFCEAHTCNRKEQLARLETVAQGPDQIGSANRQQGVSLVKDYEEDKSILRALILGHDVWVEVHQYYLVLHRVHVRRCCCCCCGYVATISGGAPPTMLTELRVPGELDRRALRAFPVQCVAVWALLLLCMLRIPPKGQWRRREGPRMAAARLWMRVAALPGQDTSQAAMFFIPLAKKMPAALQASFTLLLKPLSSEYIKHKPSPSAGFTRTSDERDGRA
ncbi:MAG: hypothetical protein FRX49_04371 [Trebouxia sp. A1-2]|nr:MAG: hypothetical protein FRX49_04371 [Trebouxia sp. A1-2]